MGIPEKNGDSISEDLKQVSVIEDSQIAEWMSMDIGEIQDLYSDITKIEEGKKEHLLLLLNFLKNGNRVFGSYEVLNDWLSKENFFFDNKAPGSFLNKISGIKFTNDRLCPIEHGDNV